MNIRKLLQLIPDKPYIQLMFFYHMHRFANLRNPKTFNEKLQWLKLYDRNPKYIQMVDKYKAKDYVADIIGKEFIIPTLGVWEKPDDINFDSLPNKFVLKWNHDSGSVIICKEKKTFDKDAAIKKLRHGQYTNGFWYGREWPYKGVKPYLIAETFLENEPDSRISLEEHQISPHSDIVDFKFMCFNGKMLCCFTCTDRFSNDGLKVTFYDKNWEIMPFERNHPRETVPCKRPFNFDKMVWAAERLSIGIPFARIDFYEVNQKPYFGEITLYPGSGLEAFQPDKWDEIMGSWLSLPNYNNYGEK